MGTLEWPHANSGHAEHFGYVLVTACANQQPGTCSSLNNASCYVCGAFVSASRVIPNMTGASLSNFSATCTLGYDDGEL